MKSIRGFRSACQRTIFKATTKLEIDSYSVLLLLTMLLVIVAMLAFYYLISEITDSFAALIKAQKRLRRKN